MFYKIYPTLNKAVTGVDSYPCETAIYPINIWDPLYIGQWHFTEVPDYVILPNPKIKSNARLLDLMKASFNGSSHRLTISNRLKLILEKYSHGNIQFLPISLYYKKKYIDGYWLTNIIKFDNEKLNYQKSGFEVQQNLTKVLDVTFKSFEEYLNYSKNLEWPYHLFITRPVISKETTENILIIKDVYGGFYHISEALKEEIVKEGFTGFEFQPIEQG